MLANGDQGHDVRVLQQDLVDRGYLAADEVTGTYDYGTEQAVMALEGYNDLNHGGVRDGIASAAVRALAAGGDRPKPKHGGPAHVEVSLTQQVLMLVRKGGLVARAIHISSGAGGKTPAGNFAVYSKATMSWSKPFKTWLPFASYFTRRLRAAPVPDRPGLPGLARLRAHAVERGAARVRLRHAPHARLRGLGAARLRHVRQRRARPAHEALGTPRRRGEGVGARQVGDRPPQLEGSARAARPLRALPGDASLLHQHDAPRARASAPELEAHLDAAVGGLEAQLGADALAADGRHAHLAAAVLRGRGHGEDGREREGGEAEEHVGGGQASHDLSLCARRARRNGTLVALASPS